MNRLRRWILPLLALIGAPAAAATAPAPKPVDIDPALWVVVDQDTTIYLFGTVHALDGRALWFNDEIKRAFDTSNELVLEVVVPDDPAPLQAILTRIATEPSGPSLTEKLSPLSRRRLAAVLKKHSMPANALDRYKPFYAEMILSSLEMGGMGLKRDSGVEMTLSRAAATAKKPISGVETMEYQLGLFANMSEKEQLRTLEESLGDLGKLPDTVDTLTRAWGRGDADKVASLLGETDKESPKLFKALVIDRNRHWADWIAERMKQPGTVFMAVGAGHLAGKQSVQRALQRLGLRATRVPHAD